MSLKSRLAAFFTPSVAAPDDSQLRIAVTAMTSLPQWPAFVEAFMARREQWLDDTKGPQVYRDHAELAHVTARIAELDHWIELFESASKSVQGDGVP